MPYPEAKIQRVGDHLHRVTLAPPITGFEAFITVWVLTGSVTAVVDVGPSATAGHLLRALKTLHLDRLDFILLTHIHLDHAGAIGDVAQCFPDAPVVCHAVGIPHLIDPARLQAGTVKTLGAVGEAYGPVTPVPADRLVAAARFKTGGIEAIVTPGHAAHHVSYLTGSHLFAGEAGGVYLALPDGSFYLRPATPPRLFLETALESIDALIARRPSVIHYGHYGTSRDAVGMLQGHRRQLRLWEREISAAAAQKDGTPLEERCLHRLLQTDPLLAGFQQLPPAVQQREAGFLTNSIRGFIGYLDGR